MSLLARFERRSIRWKILTLNFITTALSLIFLMGVQVFIQKLLTQSEESHASVKATRLVGSVLASIEDFEGVVELSRLALEKKAESPADDLRIGSKDVKANTLDLLGEIAAIASVSDNVEPIKAALDGMKSKVSTVVNGSAEGTLTVEAIEAGLESIATLKNAIKHLEDFLIIISMDASQFVQQLAKVYLVGLALCLAMMACGIALSMILTRNMVHRFERSLTSVRQAAEDLRLRTASLVDQSNSLSSQATEGAAAVQETVSTLDEISAMVTRTMDKVNLSTSSSEKNFHSAESGRSTIHDATSSMQVMKGTIEQFSQQVMKQNEGLSDVVKVITDISVKTKMINDIVFQTKLLSFNASVESARAGEHGKGFAVVAEEVGNLAEMSGNAAKEISDMVESGVKSVTDLIEASRERVEALAEDAKSRTVDTATRMGHSAAVLDDIAAGIGKVKEYNLEILSASKEQVTGIKNISTAMNALSQSISVNASSANATAETAVDFQRLGHILDENMLILSGEVFGHDGTLTASESKNPSTF